MNKERRLSTLEDELLPKEIEPEPVEPEESISPEKLSLIIRDLEAVLATLKMGWIAITYNKHFAASVRADGLPVYPYQFWFNPSTCPSERWEYVGHLANWVRVSIAETYAKYEMEMPTTLNEIIALTECELAYCKNELEKQGNT